jgi:hypothetical protein
MEIKEILMEGNENHINKIRLLKVHDNIIKFYFILCYL